MFDILLLVFQILRQLCVVGILCGDGIDTPTSEQKKATLDKTELEAYVAIVTGAQPIDYFDTFVSEWKRLGGDAIAQEVQEYFAQ